MAGQLFVVVALILDFKIIAILLFGFEVHEYSALGPCSM